MQILMGLVGVATIISLAFLLSTDRSLVKRRTVVVALALQAMVAALDRVLADPAAAPFRPAWMRGL